MTVEQPNKPVSRRGFLIGLTGSALAASTGNQAVSAQPVSVQGVPLPPFHPDAVRDAQWGTLRYNQPVLTPTDQLYTARYSRAPIPRLTADHWRLTIDGLVDNPCSLSLVDIHALPVLADARVLEALSNPAGGGYIGNVSVKGADFAEIVTRIGIKPTATHVKLEAADGYTTAVPIERITRRGVMLAYEMNGAALTAEHGYPLRLMIPGLYGLKMPRWLTRITFLDHDYFGYWEQHGLSATAEVRTKSIIHAPTTGSQIVAGQVIVMQGVAVAGTRDITRVEVQIDDGEWVPADLTPAASPYAWRQWHWQWIAPAPGVYRVGVRATDDTGFVQHEEADRRLSATPHGTSAIHRITLHAI